MICPRCGHNNTDDSRYCISCGADLTKSSRSRGLPPILIGLTAFLATVFLVLLLFSAVSGSGKSDVAKDGGTGETSASAETSAPTEIAENPDDQAELAQEPEENPATPTASDSGEETPAAETSTKVSFRPAVDPEKYYYYGGHTYAFYYTNDYGITSFWDVVEFCHDQGGHLATINDAEENQFLFDTVEQNYATTAFFGYTDDGDEGHWYWTDGDSDYTNWTNEPGFLVQPDNGKGYGVDEDYAEFNYERNTASPNDGTWNDAPFTHNTTRFICEWDFEIE